MKTIKKQEIFFAPRDVVFHYLDDLGVTGTHMTKSSMMMMGSHLDIAFLTEQKTGLGTKHRWTAKMMGLKMDFTVEVTQWVPGVEKTWETIGTPRLIIYSWYRMHLILSENNGVTYATLSITYEKPSGFFQRILCRLFADWYCRWCLKTMLGDCKKKLAGQNGVQMNSPAVT